MCLFVVSVEKKVIHLKEICVPELICIRLHFMSSS